MLDFSVHDAEVEIQLPSVFGFEGAGLEFHHHVAAQLEVIEEQVDEEIVAANLDMYLPTDEGEPRAEFDQELGDVLDQSCFDGSLLGILAQPEKIESVGIFQRFARQVGLRRGQLRRKITRCSTFRRSGPQTAGLSDRFAGS